MLLFTRLNYLLFFPISIRQQWILACCLLLLFLPPLFAQIPAPGGGQIHGNMGMDAQFYQRDTLIGAPDVPEKFRMNSFLNLVYTNGNFYAGMRYEAWLPKPLLGFDSRFEGQGIPFRYAGYKTDFFDITVGTFYEQFGNGLILRAYEERALGVDLALDGLRINVMPKTGIVITGLVGKQRYFWGHSPGTVKGFDAEINFNSLFPEAKWNKFRWVLGGSFVSRYQDGQEIPNPDNPTQLLEIPLNVGAFSGRSQIGIGKFRFNLEYAHKINDPNLTNAFIYRPGSAFYFSGNYSAKGLGITFQAKRVENMDFRSDRNETGNVLLLNFIPMLNRQHTYTLAATVYPYAVQNNGEIGFQADINYTTKKWFRGKYPTLLHFNFSNVNALDTTLTGNRYGYTSEPLGFGRHMFLDCNFEIQQKLSKSLKLNLMYMFLHLDRNLVQGLGNSPRNITAHIAVADLLWNINKIHSIRFEAQSLFTPQELSHQGDRVNGSWAMGLIEYTISPRYFLTLMDQYAFGNPVPDYRVHYITVNAGINMGTTRIMLGYGSQREGIICIGGVCRPVPAATGFTLSMMGFF